MEGGTAGTAPVLIFVEVTDQREPAQQTFVDEVQTWAAGRFRESFGNADDLKDKVIRALRDLAVVGPADEAEMRTRGEAALPMRGNNSSMGSPTLVVASGPRRQLLRPAELEETSLIRRIQQGAMFGADAPLDGSAATDSGWTAIACG